MAGGKERKHLAEAVHGELSRRAVSPALIKLARTIAADHKRDPALVCAVIEQESEWNPWATRYEPKFLSRYVAPLYTKGEISATEAYTRAMSWGLMQVMGQTAREFGFKGQFLSELCDPETNLKLGCRILAARLKRARHEDGRADEAAALLAYNGGGNANYPAEVLARKSNYEKENLSDAGSPVEKTGAAQA